jgi:hypothetical protein
MSTFRELTTTDQNAERLVAELNRTYEKAQEEPLALLQSRPAEQVVSPVHEWMNATQLAEYCQLYNDKNEPTTAGILKWSKRSPDQFPLPQQTWVTYSDSIVMRLISGHMKKLKDDECRMKSDVSRSLNPRFEKTSHRVTATSFGIRIRATLTAAIP